jgi:hypothetical protein
MLLFCSIAPPAYISSTNVGSFLAARLPRPRQVVQLKLLQRRFETV